MRPLALGTLLLTVAALSACATAGEVEERTTALEARLRPVQTKAERCAPRDLAYAHAAIADARRSSQVGDGAAASRALDRAASLVDAVTDEPRLARCVIPQAPSPKRADGDGDGVPDDEDRCLSEREDRDGWLDHDGCPDPDNDGDGISDQVDQCPNIPEVIDGVADIDGCPDGEPSPENP